MFSLLLSDYDMDCHGNTYEGLLERCGSAESSNTNCVKVAYILMELWNETYSVSQMGKYSFSFILTSLISGGTN